MTVYDEEFLFSRFRRVRQRNEILHDVLTIARNGDMKTRIMFGANLSWLSVTKFLKLAEVAGLIEEIEAEERYWINKPTLIWRTTEKGLRYVQSIHEYSKMFDEVEK